MSVVARQPSRAQASALFLLLRSPRRAGENEFKRPSMCRVLVLLALVPTLAHAAAPPARVPLLGDTDIGVAMDDAVALAWLLAEPRADVRAITTVHGDAHTRAVIVCRMLHAIGRADIPVAAGAPPRPVPDFGGQMQYGLRPAH